MDAPSLSLSLSLSLVSSEIWMLRCVSQVGMDTFGLDEFLADDGDD